MKSSIGALAAPISFTCKWGSNDLILSLSKDEGFSIRSFSPPWFDKLTMRGEKLANRR